MKDNFYTLTTYLHENKFITYAMEDYLEMLYRQTKNHYKITITNLSNSLNIKKSSCSKMISKLKNYHLVYNKDNYLYLTKSGLKIGKYLYHRHYILSIFFQKLNKDKYTLAQVEKVEHFIDYETLKNISQIIFKI